MSTNTVVFVSHHEQENLGVGYLSAMLVAQGFKVENLDFQMPFDEIYSQIQKKNPLIVGFSLIFQYHSFFIKNLAKSLRNKGIDCHFTIGGHYPSLRFEDILKYIPEIDSVVRFEGEFTLCELANSIKGKSNWKKIKGIAYRNKKNIPISTEIRPLIQNLDDLPFPMRLEENRTQCLGINLDYILASRGCVRNCSFCSVRQFYGTPEGKLKRIRNVTSVVNEMKDLYENSNVKIFLFQDDDFPITGNFGRKWSLDFINELNNKDLANQILWKISCRSDEVNFELFFKLKKVGLSLVYLGIESGNQAGLDLMNKQLTVEDHIKAIDILNKLNINFEYGFMLFEPTSTFKSLKSDIEFLRKISGNGNSPVVFCKMIPYAETDIEKKLVEEGRLKGTITNPDYDFHNPRLDNYYTFLTETFFEWMYKPEGIHSRLRWHRFEVVVLKKFHPDLKNLSEYEMTLKKIIKLYNNLFFEIVERTINIFENEDSVSKNQLQQTLDYLNEEQEKITKQWHNNMANLQEKQ